MDEPWILFEAGALARSLSEGYVVPVLLDVEEQDLSGPLAQFHAKKFDPAGMLSVVQTLNRVARQQVTSERLNSLFEDTWPRLKSAIETIPESPIAKREVRSQNEILEELVSTVRSMSARIIGSSTTEADGLNKAADEIKCAIRLFDKKSLRTLYENRLAMEDNPRDARSDQSSLDGLVQLMKETGMYRAETLVWDATRHIWRRRRLFDCEYCYWLVDELEPVKGGADLSHWKLIEAGHHNWEERMNELSALLKRDLGITRVRLYRVIALYEPDNEQQTYLMQPLWQRGGGFDPDARAWLNHEYLMDESPDASRAFGESRPRWIISPVDDRKPSALGAKAIRFGSAKSRADIPVEHVGSPCALLALDRRRDHLESSYDLASARRIWGDGIEERDMDGMEGLLELIKPMLVNALLDRDRERFAKWNEKLTSIIEMSVAEGDARLAFKLALSQIREQWDAGHVDVRDVYLMLVREDGRLEPWAGSGPIWECRKGKVFDKTRPFSEAVTKTFAIHNFPAWLAQLTESEKAKIKVAFKDHPQVLDNVGSWLGIPLKQGISVFGIMVICVTRRHYFTPPRVKGFENTAARLMPVLLWGLAQGVQELPDGLRPRAEALDPAFQVADSVRKRATQHMETGDLSEHSADDARISVIATKARGAKKPTRGIKSKR